MDKGRSVAERGLAQVRERLAEAQSLLREIGEHRRFNQLLHDLGEAYYAEHRGEGSHEAVTRAIADLDAYPATTAAAAPASDAPPLEAVPSEPEPPDASPVTPPGAAPPDAGPSPATAPEGTPPDTPRPD